MSVELSPVMNPNDVDAETRPADRIVSSLLDHYSAEVLEAVLRILRERRQAKQAGS